MYKSNNLKSRTLPSPLVVFQVHPNAIEVQM